jgi:hypothetical protein
MHSLAPFMNASRDSGFTCEVATTWIMDGSPVAFLD